MTKLALAAAFTTAAVGICAGTSSAAPAAPADAASTEATPAVDAPADAAPADAASTEATSTEATSTEAVAAGVGFTAHATETSSIITIDSGSLVVEDQVLKIKAADGTVVAGAPLTFRVDDFAFPIVAEISERTATLSPQFDLAHATYQPVALPFEDKAPWKTEYDREQAAWSRLTSTVSMGATIGTLVGGIGGASVVCFLGGIDGAHFAAPPIVGMFGP
ncbi:hypothetical protein, partial [Nocardia sp. NPDC057455]|uniref:hypothetical protein n=1 Tax=Nocardia sp. NPDC057455 TaxID=3346138 RepID=UPI00366DB15D